jgi:hypothetical protein
MAMPPAVYKSQLDTRRQTLQGRLVVAVGGVPRACLTVLPPGPCIPAPSRSLCPPPLNHPRVSAV